MRTRKAIDNLIVIGINYARYNATFDLQPRSRMRIVLYSKPTIPMHLHVFIFIHKNYLRIVCSNVLCFQGYSVIFSFRKVKKKRKI